MGWTGVRWGGVQYSAVQWEVHVCMQVCMCFVRVCNGVKRGGDAWYTHHQHMHCHVVGLNPAQIDLVGVDERLGGRALTALKVGPTHAGVQAHLTMHPPSSTAQSPAPVFGPLTCTSRPPSPFLPFSASILFFADESPRARW